MDTRLAQELDQDAEFIATLRGIADELPEGLPGSIGYSTCIYDATIHIRVHTLGQWKRARHQLGRLIKPRAVHLCQHDGAASRDWWYTWHDHKEIDVCLSWHPLASSECLIPTGERVVPVFDVTCPQAQEAR